MKGSDIIVMTINIGGEPITLDVDFDDQINIRETERAIKAYIDRLKKLWPQNSDRNILAFTAFQFARSYHKLLKIQEEALEATNLKIKQIEDFSISINSDSDNSLG